MRNRALLLMPVLAIVLLAVFGGCGDDATTTTTPNGDGGSDGASSADGSSPNDSGGQSDTGNTGGNDAGGDADAGADADAGSVVISSDSNSPTPLALNQNVTADLAANAENFFEFTTTSAGDYTLHFTSPASTYYASFSATKGSHLCGLPQCVQGTGTATLTGLAAATTYYLNLFNGSVSTGSYTISVTLP